MASTQVRADVVERLAEADAIDLAVRREARHQHGGVVAAALGVGRLREQERLALGLRDAAAELPAHQRVHLGVFVDRLVDDDQQALARERQHVLVQVGIAARMPGRAVAIALERGARALSDRPSIHHPRAAEVIAQPCRDARTRRASSLAKPSTCRPSGMPSTSNSGSDSAGTPSSEHGTANCGLPVDCRSGRRADRAPTSVTQRVARARQAPHRARGCGRVRCSAAR